jgi:hypothetical protein
MARAAVAKAAGDGGSEALGVRLRTWCRARPFVVGEGTEEVAIELVVEDGIHSQDADGEGSQPVIHSQNLAFLNSVAEAPAIDVSGLRARCSGRLVSTSEC